jgi:hypothetical protein
MLQIGLLRQLDGDAGTLSHHLGVQRRRGWRIVEESCVEAVREGWEAGTAKQ